MVLEDQEYILKSHPDQKKKSSDPKASFDRDVWSLAAPLDRIAASVVDVFVVLSPVIAVAVAPFRRQLMTSVLLNNQNDFTSSISTVVLVTLLLTVVYITMFTWRFGATLGMMFMKIRVIRIWQDSPPDLYHSFLRTSVWLLNFCLLGLPNISVFSNKHRRSLHDRISDTVVISTNSGGVGAPSQMEYSISRGVFVGILAFILPLFFARVIEFRDVAVGEFYSIEQEDEITATCRKVDDAISDWPSEEGKNSEKRLNAAMTLYAAGILDEECLSKESESLFRKKIESPLSYFAKAFVYLDNPEISNDYLDIVCERWPKSNACIMTQLVEKWSDEDQIGVEELLLSVSANGQDYMNVWATRQLLMSGKFKEAERHLEKVRPNHALSRFIAFNKIKILWGVKKQEEARNVASVSYSTLPKKERFALSGWLCHQEIVRGCGFMSTSSCRVMEQTVGGANSIAISSADTLLAVIDLHECKNSEQVDYVEIAKKVDDKNLRRYLATLEYIRDKKIDEQVDVLSTVVADLQFDSALRFDGQKRLVKLSRNAGEMKSILKDWNENRGGQEWENLGFTIFSKLNEFKNYKDSYPVGELLLALNNEDYGFLKEMVMASFRSGHPRKSWAVYKKYLLNREKITRNQRDVASADEFSTVVRKLKKRYMKR